MPTPWTPEESARPGRVEAGKVRSSWPGWWPRRLGTRPRSRPPTSRAAEQRRGQGPAGAVPPGSGTPAHRRLPGPVLPTLRGHRPEDPIDSARPGLPGSEEVFGAVVSTSSTDGLGSTDGHKPEVDRATLSVSGYVWTLITTCGKSARAIPDRELRTPDHRPPAVEDPRPVDAPATLSRHLPLARPPTT